MSDDNSWPRILKKKEAAEYMGVSTWKIRQWTKEGYELPSGERIFLPVIRLSPGKTGGIRYRREALDEFLSTIEQEVPVAKEA